MSTVEVVNGGVQPTVKIRPPGALSPLALGELWKFRDLLWALAIRDVKLRYRQTSLGVMWVVLQPLLGTAIFTFVFAKIVGFSIPGLSYTAFVFVGMMAWQAFSTTLTKSSACVLGNAQLVSKVYFPRLALPLSTVLSTLIDFLVTLPVLAAVMWWYNVTPGPQILLLPVWLFLLVLLAVGVGLYASAMMVTYRDLQYVIPVLMQFLIFASPVAYKPPKDWPILSMLNPLTGLMDGFRWSVLDVKPPYQPLPLRWEEVAYSVAVTFGMFIFGAFMFKRMERRFADVI